MAKELIISANVYEKRVALVEDGVVTEFYVERRDENQGVVGNLYKGRVMKVLPGMQSAFVDIGLERDAFLYVSDFAEFMDDEEEVDFKEVSDTATAIAPKPADDKVRRGDRRDRDTPYQRPERPAGREGLSKEPAVEALPFEDAVEQLAEIAHERVIPAPPPEDLDEGANGAATIAATGVEEASVTVIESPSFVRVEDAHEKSYRDSAPAFYAERITDDDVVRDTPAAKVEPSPVVASPLTDEVESADEEEVEEKPKRGRSRKKVAEAEPEKSKGRSRKAVSAEPAPEALAVEAGKKTKGSAKRPAKKRRGAPDDTLEAGSSATPFERIVDEDAGHAKSAKEKKADKANQKTETVVEKTTSSFKAEPEPEWKVGSFRSQAKADAGFQRIEDENSHLTKAETSTAANAEAPANEPAFQPISEAVPVNLLEFMQHSDGSESSAAETGEEEKAASLRDSGNRAEFAMRRGGRNRRRGPQRRDGKPGAPGAAPLGEEAGAEGEAEEAVEVAAQEGAPSRRPEPQRRPEPSRRPEPQRRSEPSRRPERGNAAPTISELLREGQEVLVQIAKEPIAKKGARITSHIALPGRYMVYMPTVNHIGVSRKIPSDQERIRLKRLVTALRDREGAPGGFIARTACAGIPDQQLHDDLRYLVRTWNEIRKKGERVKPPALVHRDLDLIQRILRDQLSEEFSVIRVDNELEYARIVEFVNRVQPRLVNRVKLYTGNQPIFEKYNVQPEIDKAVKPRVWLRSGGYIVINQTEALVAIDVNTGKFVGKSDKLEDTITKTNLEAAKEIVRQIRLRDLGGIIVVDFIDMEERKNRQRVMQTLQEELANDRSPSKILSINDFGLLAITRKRVKQSLERTLCTPCPYCQGGGMVKSPQTMCFEILEQTKAISEQVAGSSDIMLRVSPMVAEALHTSERQVFEEIEAYFGTPVTIEADPNLHQEQYDFAIA
ncbi:MAG: Rne/Rng family ribonuclease [Acidobacteria bacterium]|nr:Rne/Rng family ribonuclease [Acidobacteriota bacterium]